MLLGALSQRLKEWQDVFAQRRTHQRAVVVGMGLLCGLGQRTITRALTYLGWGNRDWSANYKLFSRSPWKAEDLFVPVLR